MLRSSIWVHFMTVLIFKNGILEFTSGFHVLTLMAFYKIKTWKKKTILLLQYTLIAILFIYLFYFIISRQVSQQELLCGSVGRAMEICRSFK